MAKSPPKKPSKSPGPSTEGLSADVRKEAEKRVAWLDQKGYGDMDRRIRDMNGATREDIERVLHELQVHQVELQMQNEALRQAQAEIEASRTLYADLYDFAPVGYISLDRSGFIREANLTAASMLGVLRAKLKGMPLLKFIPSAYRHAFHAHLDKAFTEATKQTVEFRLESNGKTLYVSMESLVTASSDEDGDVCRSVIIDITRSKLAEEERARLVAAVEQAAEGIMILDPHMKVLYANPAAGETRGYKPEELIGKKLMTFYRSKDGGSDALERMRTRLATGMPWAGRLTGLKKDGSTFLADMTISPVADSSSPAIVNYVAVCRDVTSQVALETRVYESQKLEAIGTLAGGIAHDFNNILAAIIGFSEMAADDAEKASQQERHLQHVLKAGIRGRELVKQILAFSRKAEPKKSLQLMSALVEESLRLLRATLPSTVAIHFNMLGESGLIFGDPTQLQQVIINLCTNAAHAMRETGGVISVELSDFSFFQAKEAPVPGLVPGLYAKLSVQDTGQGIPRENLHRIFEPFFTTKKQGEGSGLGLSVAHGIMESHKGTISVASEPGQGSTFTLYLPRHTEAREAEAPRKGALLTGHERILFIDDEATLAEMGEKLLAGLGYQVVHQTSSREALAIFRLDPSKFDLVITDQTMPEITGVQLAGEILAIRPDMPVILCTGFSHQVDADSAQAAGIRAFLNKPLTKREMGETVRRILDERTR